MRWRGLDEVKAGKGERVCANVECGRTEGLETMDVVFGYMEEGKRRDVLVKCVLCGKCARKMRKARETDDERKGKRRRRHSREREEPTTRVERNRKPDQSSERSESATD